MLASRPLGEPGPQRSKPCLNAWPSRRNASPYRYRILYTFLFFLDY